MAISNRAWGPINESDYDTPEEFCAASLIDLNPAEEPKAKAWCKLPVREPGKLGGRLNRNAVHAAASRIHTTDAPANDLGKAARALLRLYARLDEQPPDRLRELGR